MQFPAALLGEPTLFPFFSTSSSFSSSLTLLLLLVSRCYTTEKKRKKGEGRKRGGKKQRGRTKRCRDRGEAKRTKVASRGKLKGGRDVNENDNVEVEL